MPYSWNAIHSKFDLIGPGGGLLPIIQIDTDNGSVFSNGGLINLTGRSTDEYNLQAIRVIADPNNSENAVIQLTNRIIDSVQTTDATPTDMGVKDLGNLDGVYVVWGQIMAWNITDGISTSYNIIGSAKTVSSIATEISQETQNIFFEVGMEDIVITFGVRANETYITVTGLAGKTINFKTFLEYRFVG